MSIDYRLGMKRALDAGPIDGERFPGVLASTLAMATEDLRDATAFVCRRAAEWGVDPQRILTSGSSAGAMTVLMAEYALCNGDSVFVRHLPEEFRYAGVIAYAGAVYDPSGEQRWTTPPAPLLLFHGDADRNVPYDTVPVPGGGVLFGSAAVARDLAQRGVPYWFVSEAGADHSMAWRPMREHFAEIDAFLDRFVFGGERRRFETRIVPPDAPERPAAFAIDDYLDANYGHYVPGKNGSRPKHSEKDTVNENDPFGLSPMAGRRHRPVDSGTDARRRGAGLLPRGRCCSISSLPATDRRPSPFP